MQNAYASDLTPDQRRAQEAHNLSMNATEKIGGSAAFGVDPEGVWEGVKGWVGAVGAKVAEAEKEAWRRMSSGRE